MSADEILIEDSDDEVIPITVPKVPQTVQEVVLSDSDSDGIQIEEEVQKCDIMCLGFGMRSIFRNRGRHRNKRTAKVEPPNQVLIPSPLEDKALLPDISDNTVRSDPPISSSDIKSDLTDDSGLVVDNNLDESYSEQMNIDCEDYNKNGIPSESNDDLDSEINRQMSATNELNQTIVKIKNENKILEPLTLNQNTLPKDVDNTGADEHNQSISSSYVRSDLTDEPNSRVVVDNNIDESVSKQMTTDFETNYNSNNYLNNSENEPIGEYYVCSYDGCGEEFNNAILHYKHEKKHSNELIKKKIRTFKCRYSDCHFLGLTQIELMYHNSEHRGIFLCQKSECQFRAKSADEVTQHMRFHRNSKKRPLRKKGIFCDCGQPSCDTSRVSKH